MPTEAIRHLNVAIEKIKELAADRDAWIERATRAEAKLAEQKDRFEREISRLKTDRDKLLRIIDKGAAGG